MGPTHRLIIDDNQVLALGEGNYFSWLIEFNCGEWDLSTIYGRMQGSFKTFAEVLKSIDYEENYYERI
jgi:hypothetical protein